MNLFKSNFWARLVTVVLFATLTFLSACATGPKLVDHSFSFDGWFDKWAEQVYLLEYDYGGKYSMVSAKHDPNRVVTIRGVPQPNLSLSYQININSDMPVGEYLYVKWKLKATNEIIENKVDLRNRLPSDMTNHKLTFVIDGKQLYVYAVTPKNHPVNPKGATILKTYLSKYNVTYEVYPTNTYKP